MGGGRKESPERAVAVAVLREGSKGKGKDGDDGMASRPCQLFRGGCHLGAPPLVRRVVLFISDHRQLFSTMSDVIHPIDVVV